LSSLLRRHGVMTNAPAIAYGTRRPNFVLNPMDVMHPLPKPTISPRNDEAVTIIGGDPSCGIVLVCDHAANTIPPEYGTLGLDPSELSRHIAYDIGAEGVTRAMAARLGAPAVLTKFSRLLIDPNRGEDDPTLIMRLSDGAIIAGNRTLDEAERAARIARFYTPYHDAVAALVDASLTTGVVPIVIAIHSFTPVWKGVPRPWHVGVLWDKDPRFAVPLIEALAQDRLIIVGDNEPYHGALKGDTLWKHATQRGLAHALIEVRQDLIATAQGQDAWADRLAATTTALLDDAERKPHLQTIEHYGSQTDIWPIQPALKGRT